MEWDSVVFRVFSTSKDSPPDYLSQEEMIRREMSHPAWVTEHMVQI